MKKISKLVSCLLCACVSLSALVFTGCKGQEPSTESSFQQSSSVDTPIRLDKTEYSLYENEEFTLTALLESAQTVAWSSSDYSIASVSSAGRVLAKKEGTVVITARTATSSDSCTVTVKKAVAENGAEIRTDKTAYLLSLADGNGLKIDASYVVDDGEDQTADETKTLSFVSLNEAVTTVAADGVLTPVSIGTTDVVISYDGVSSYVTVDVYTDGISTAEEWMEMIKNSCTASEPTTEKRYFLENDIDFSGVEYDIGQTAVGANNETSNPYHFGTEINGNFHKVCNITAWKEDAASNKDAHQSIFGRTIGATVKNVSFENITFTSANSFGLASVLMNHTSLGKVKDNTFTNVFADFSYAYQPANNVKGNKATGVTPTAYSVYMNNVFIRMRSANGTNLQEQYNDVYGFAHAEWVWYGGGLTNVITLIEDVPEGSAAFINDAAGDQNYKHAKVNCYVAETVIEASYYAHQIFSETTWDLNPEQIPVLKQGNN